MNNRFSLILKELLIKKNLKKMEFARKVGVKSQTTITNWLKGIGSPDWDQLLKIKKELKLKDIRELFGFEEAITSVDAKLEALKKQFKEKEDLIIKLERDKAILEKNNGLIWEQINKKDDQIRIKDDQIEKYDAHAKRMEKLFNLTSPSSKIITHHHYEEGQSGVSVGAEEKPEEQTPH